MRRQLLQVFTIGLVAVTASPRQGHGASGGPDAGGYSWRDSQEPGVSPDPNLFTGTTTPIALTDESVQPVPLPFPFAFYGAAPTTTVWLSDNGWLSFVAPAGPAPANAAIPDAAAPGALAAFYWDDLDPNGGFASHGAIAGGYGILLREFQKSDGSMIQVMIELYPTGRLRFSWILTGTPATISVGIEDETGARGTELVHDGTEAPGFRLAGTYAVEFLPPSRLPCGTAPVVACGSSTAFSTLTGTALVSAYACSAASFAGRELVVELDIADTSSVTATLSGFAPRQLSLFLLTACNESFCTGGGGPTATAPALRPGRYYLAVDGASAADDGAFQLTVTCGAPTVAVHSGWRENPGEAQVPVSPPYAVRGDPAEFSHAAFPPRGDPLWLATADPNFVYFDGRSTLCAYACGAALEFSYYRTCLWLPSTFSELVVSAAHVDDGILVQVNGAPVSTGQLGPYQSPNIAGHPALVPGALNDIEVVHVDDCCTVTALRNLTFTVDGQTARADWVDRCEVQAAVAPVTGNRCPGTPVTLDASASTSLTCTVPLQYRWREGTAVLSPFSTSPTVNVAPTATTTYAVDVLCANGCGCQSTVEITVPVSPAIALAVPARVSICTGQGADLGGSPTASGGTAPLVHAWTPTTGLDDPASPNPRATPAATTTYRLEVTDAIGCKASADQTVEVGGGMPGSVGNTLLGVDQGADVLWSWSTVAAALTYNVKTELDKRFAAPLLLGNALGTTYTHAGAVPAPPMLVHYRVVGVGCGGAEGP